MNLRLDVLLARLRTQMAEVLQAIDSDPLLVKKTSGDLVLANASLELYTPQVEHQLYAKGIVYQRDPYRLVSLPLIKIYNLGEREVTVQDLSSILTEPDVQLRFLSKLDGSLIQVFTHANRLWFSTRGTIDGARFGTNPENESTGFDFLGTARQLLAQQSPHLVEAPTLIEGQTLLFEFLHPGAPHITQYGDREELVLIAAFDHREGEYLSYERLGQRAEQLGLPLVDALAPQGTTLAERIEGLLALLAGTDHEGSVLNFERAGQVLYRVKVKTPDYLRLLRAMSLCSYDRAEAILTEHPTLDTWEAFEAHLRSLGRDIVPEEILPYYRPHFDRYRALVATCEAIRAWTMARLSEVLAALDPELQPATPTFRKAFATTIAGKPGTQLLFSALDGRLDLATTRRIAGDLDEARALLTRLQGQSSGSSNSH